jgi:RNA 2',3'-cyclic 3'-phosphodiesterase
VGGAATVEADERLRLFIALELPRDVEETIRAWSERELAGGRRPGTLHVTLAFLGSRPRSDVDSIVGALRESVAETAPFELEPVRYRETRFVGMLVLGDRSGDATRLAGRLQERLEELGVYRREARPWLPHITVVRFRERLRVNPEPPEIRPFAPSGAAAFLSRLHRSGAEYEVIESCPLGGPPEGRSMEDVESGG